jgi:hypothetical protein
MRMRSSWSSLAVAFVLYSLVAIAPFNAALAFKAPPGLGQLEEDDQKALETIADNDEHLRDAVLKASLHVDALVETQRIQERSSASFQDRISKLDKKQQEQIWEIVREPGLLDELTADGRPGSAQLDEIAERHPESLSPAIHDFGTKQHDLLVDVADIHSQARSRFDVAISKLDADSQQAFRDLVDHPELLSVLVHRVNVVVRLGDSYRKNPNDTRKYLSALADDVAKRNAADREEWKKRIENDPNAAKEIDEAAREYSEENGYDYDELTSPEAATHVQVAVYPYPYWYGYPYWYANAYLYPYGYWYPYPVYFGYYPYYDHFVWWGVPPFAFVGWFYGGHHHHYYHYAHNCFNGHFSHSRSASTFRNTAARDFIARADQPGSGGRSAGPGGRSTGTKAMSADGGSIGRSASAASYGKGDRGFFFNRSQPNSGLDRPGRKTASGARGLTMDSQRSVGSDRSAQSPGVRGGRNFDRSNGKTSGAGADPNFFQRSNPKSQRDAAPTEPRGRAASEWSHAPRAVDRQKEWAHAPRVTREAPSAEPPASRGGGERQPGGAERQAGGAERRGGGGERRGGPVDRSGGGDDRVVQGGGDDGGGQRFGGGAPSYRGGNGRAYGGDGGGYRSRGWSGGGGSYGGGRGWGGGGDFGGGGYGGGGFGGGGRGGGFGGGGRGR